MGEHVTMTNESEHGLPRNEAQLRDRILTQLRQALVNLVVESEGPVCYCLPCGTRATHKSDILVSQETSRKRVSIEIKYKSAVTDQFKCRAYDAMHMKEEYRDQILTVMVFAKTSSGISLERARAISYPFDRFFGDCADRFLQPEGTQDLEVAIRGFFSSP